MAIPFKTRDPAQQINDYGRVAARVRVYDSQTGAEVRPPIGPIPARLRPDTIKFLQRNEPAAKPKDTPVPRKVANQLIPAPVVSQQHTVLSSSPSTYPPTGKKNATNEQPVSIHPENQAADGFFAKEADHSAIQQSLQHAESSVDVAPLDHAQIVPDQLRFSSGEIESKVSPSEPRREERLDAASDSVTAERNPITEELQDLIEQSLVDDFAPSTESEKSAGVDAYLRAVEANGSAERPCNAHKEHFKTSSSAKEAATNPSNDANGHSVHSSECCCNKISFGRFEIFLRERSRSVACSREACNRRYIRDHEADVVGEEPSKQDVVPSELGQQPKQPANRHWRWWKLILNEHETEDPTDSSKPQDNQYDETNVRQAIARENFMRSPEVEATGHTEDQVLHPVSFGQTEQQSQFTGQEMFALSIPQLLLQGNRVIRVEDVFGNGVLVDHDEIPIDALDSLCLLNTSECVSTIQRERRGQRLRQAARLEPIEPVNQLKFPKASIAPLLQNDGANSLHQHAQIDCTEPQDATRVTNSMLFTDPGEYACLAQTHEKAVTGSKTKKVVISIEDGSKKLVHIEILPGKATAVVQNETSE